MGNRDAGGRAGAEKLVCFYLGGQEYGAPITDVKETMLVRPITPVFLTPSWLAGIINLRGDVVAVLDLAQLLGQPASTIDDESRIVILQFHRPDDRSAVAGILVDRMAELRTVELAHLQPAPPTLAAASAALLEGVMTVEDGAPLRLLDLQALFDSERMSVFQRRS
jgi:purine-binding chemotaxis protein CheW